MQASLSAVGLRSLRVSFNLGANQQAKLTFALARTTVTQLTNNVYLVLQRFFHQATRTDHFSARACGCKNALTHRRPCKRHCKSNCRPNL